MIGNKTITRWLPTNRKTTNTPYLLFPFLFPFWCMNFYMRFIWLQPLLNLVSLVKLSSCCKLFGVFHNLIYFAKVLIIIELTFNYNYLSIFLNTPTRYLRIEYWQLLNSFKSQYLYLAT